MAATASREPEVQLGRRACQAAPTPEETSGDRTGSQAVTGQAAVLGALDRLARMGRQGDLVLRVIADRLALWVGWVLVVCLDPLETWVPPASLDPPESKAPPVKPVFPATPVVLDVAAALATP